MCSQEKASTPCKLIFKWTKGINALKDLSNMPFPNLQNQKYSCLVQDTCIKYSIYIAPPNMKYYVTAGPNVN